MSSAAIVAVTNSVTLWICPVCERRCRDLRKERPERNDATFSAAPCGACGVACAGVYACHAVYQAWACSEAQSERLLGFWQHRICYCRYISAWCLAMQPAAQADGARRRAKIICWLYLTFARGCALAATIWLCLCFFCSGVRYVAPLALALVWARGTAYMQEAFPHGAWHLILWCHCVMLLSVHGPLGSQEAVAGMVRMSWFWMCGFCCGVL